MRFVISGTNTSNKGAELMLYAILQQIEKKYPDAEVFIPLGSVREGLNYIKTSLKLGESINSKIERFARKYRLKGLVKRLGLGFIFIEKPFKNIDYFLDASGFLFTDQWKLLFNDSFVSKWQSHLCEYRNQGTKIVFMPQAFGPITLQQTQKIISIIGKYADIIMPREKVSYNYMKDAGIDIRKIIIFSDFTSLVHGIIPFKYAHLTNAVCFIPNSRMIDKGVISKSDYVNLVAEIARKATLKGHNIYLLNHEGMGDERCAYMIQNLLGKDIEIVTGLTALEVKGLISSSYLCVTSRFHGVASALNSCVPCLATSWSHKYAELFNDYNLGDCVLNITNTEACLEKIVEYLEPQNNTKIREYLKRINPKIIEQTEQMWNVIWSI